MNPDIPKYRHEQITQLAAMFGEPTGIPSDAEQPSIIRPSIFTPMPGALGITPTGATSWTPAPWPDWAPPAGPDATELLVFIDHTLLDAHLHPRRPQVIAELKANIDRLSSRIGIYRIAIATPPRHWSPRDIRSLADTILPLVPNDDLSVTHTDAVAEVALRPWHRRGKKKARISFNHGTDGQYFYATILIDAAATPAVREWLTRIPGTMYDENSSTLKAIDEALTNVPAASGDQNDDDDDLDAIEIASRRALHGTKNIPRTSRGSRSALTDAPYVRAVSALNALADTKNSDNALTMIACVIERLVELRGDAR